MSDQKDPIRIEIRIERAAVRRGLFVIGFVALLAFAGLAFAVPVSFVKDTTLSADDLNQDFVNLEGRMAALESFKAQATSNGTYNLGAKYCGATATKFTGNLGGYAGAKAACVSTCANSPTAHMCLPNELVQTEAVGTATPADGWYSMGTYSADNVGYLYNDCNGWTSNATSLAGAVWDGAGKRPSGVICGNSEPILCCN
jgi:hypothetical protein